MLISDKYKFATIDIQKTGTKTVRETFKPIISVVGQGGKQHQTVIECRNTYFGGDRNFDEYLKFSIVRNPWSRYVSFACYVMAFAGNYNQSLRDGTYKNLSKIAQHQGVCYNALLKTFKHDEKELLKNLIETKSPQDFYILDENKELLIDFLASTECLQQDIEFFINKVGIEEPLKITHGNKGSYSKPYQDFYNQELIDMVAEKEKWVIDYKGYDF
jgi:hypothetical protein